MYLNLTSSPNHTVPYTLFVLRHLYILLRYDYCHPCGLNARDFLFWKRMFPKKEVSRVFLNFPVWIHGNIVQSKLIPDWHIIGIIVILSSWSTIHATPHWQASSFCATSVASCNTPHKMEHAGIAHGTTVGLSVPFYQPCYLAHRPQWKSDLIKSSKIKSNWIKSDPPILFDLILWHSQNDTLSYVKLNKMVSKQLLFLK